MKKRILSMVLLVMVVCVSLTACGNKVTLDDYISSSAFQTEMTTMRSQFAGTGVEFDVKADGNKLIMAFTVPDELAVEGMEETWETAMDQQSTLFQTAADQVKAETKINDVVVVVQFLKTDGSTMFEKEYAAK